MGLNSRYEIRVKASPTAGGPPGSGTSGQQRRGGNPHLRPGRDQATLHGLLIKLRDLGLFLVSVRHLDPD